MKHSISTITGHASKDADASDAFFMKEVQQGLINGFPPEPVGFVQIDCEFFADPCFTIAVSS
jgi:hypothetical protein